jgi:hypothetical protein
MLTVVGDDVPQLQKMVLNLRTYYTYYYGRRRLTGGLLLVVGAVGDDDDLGRHRQPVV